MNNIKNFFFTKSNLLYCLIVVMMLSTITMLAPYTTELNIVLLLWGAVYFIYDFFKKKNCLKSRYKIILILYMIIFFIGIIINYRNNIVDNIKTYIYTGFFLFVLYSYDIEKDTIENSKNELITINNIIILISSIAAFIAFIMFLFLIQFNYNDITQGFIYPKTPALWGIYSNPNSGGMVAVLSIIMTYINIVLYKRSNKKVKTKFITIYYIFNIIIQWIYLVLCNSRGAALALLTSILFITFYKLYVLLNNKFNIFKSIIISILVSFIMLITFTSVVSISKSALSHIPEYVESLSKKDVELEQTEANTEINLDREIKNGHVSTGRAEIWSYGLQTLKSNPLFGHGPGNIGLEKQKLFPNDTSKYIATNNMHNGYIQILLSNGILGFASFAIFMVLIAKDSLIAIFNFKIVKDKKCRDLIVLILIPIVAIAINGMFENVILLTQSYINSVLWIYIGYLALILDKTLKNKKSSIIK